MQSVGAAGRAEAARSVPWPSWSRRCRKITDLLLDTMRHAEGGDRAGMESNLAALRGRHEDACRELLPRSAATPPCWRRLTTLIGEFERIVQRHGHAERAAAAVGG